MVTAEACRSYSFLVSVRLCSEPASDAAMQDQLGRWPITPRDNGVGDHTQHRCLNSAPLPLRPIASGLCRGNDATRSTSVSTVSSWAFRSPPQTMYVRRGTSGLDDLSPSDERATFYRLGRAVSPPLRQKKSRPLLLFAGKSSTFRCCASLLFAGMDTEPLRRY